MSIQIRHLHIFRCGMRHSNALELTYFHICAFQTSHTRASARKAIAILALAQTSSRFGRQVGRFRGVLASMGQLYPPVSGSHYFQPNCHTRDQIPTTNLHLAAVPQQSADLVPGEAGIRHSEELNRIFLEK